jgi:hypothetical protein
MFRVKPHPEKPLIWWYENRSKINMSPTYQRRAGLWTRTKKALLIDSILNEYDIPKIYLADFTYANTTLNEARTAYAVIDGKQRLETFFDFFEGTLPLSREFVFNDNPSLDLARLTYFDLQESYPKVAERFERYLPSIMSVITDEKRKVDEMFVRLNSGLHITAAERRNAMPGPLPKLIRKLVLHPFFESRISFNTRRMQEYNTVAKILLIEVKGRFVDTKARNLDGLVKDNINKSLSQFEPHRKSISKVLDKMSAIFHENDSVLSSEGPIPVYYWFVKKTIANKQYIRAFLKEFSDDVKTNLEVSQNTPERADAELTTYYTMARTTNDQASLSGRYEILQKRFQAFVKRRKRIDVRRKL